MNRISVETKHQPQRSLHLSKLVGRKAPCELPEPLRISRKGLLQHDLGPRALHVYLWPKAGAASAG